MTVFTTDIWLLVCIAATSACVSTGTHEAALKELQSAQEQLQNETAQHKACADTLETTSQTNTQLATKISSMGQNVEQLLGEKSQLAREVEQLRRIRAAAESRDQEYRLLREKLHTMIDAGTLEVKNRNGRMLVQMASDVVFAPGRVNIKDDAQQAIIQLAQTIQTFKNRRFVVVGHSDPTPIRTERFPSNWELSSQRAIQVVKLLIEAGVPAEILSAAGSAEFDPLVVNDTPESRAQNRRVEVIFEPRIDELPEFTQEPVVPTP